MATPGKGVYGASTCYRHINRFRVPFCDVDMMQHVNHASYVVWAQTARPEYFDEVLKATIGQTSNRLIRK
jgi:acyl-CoA thioesterase FadM